MKLKKIKQLILLSSLGFSVIASSCTDKLPTINPGNKIEIEKPSNPNQENPSQPTDPNQPTTPDKPTAVYPKTFTSKDAKINLSVKSNEIVLKNKFNSKDINDAAFFLDQVNLEKNPDKSADISYYSYNVPKALNDLADLVHTREQQKKNETKTEENKEDKAKTVDAKESESESKKEEKLDLFNVKFEEFSNPLIYGLDLWGVSAIQFKEDDLDLFLSLFKINNKPINKVWKGLAFTEGQEELKKTFEDAFATQLGIQKDSEEFRKQWELHYGKINLLFTVDNLFVLFRISGLSINKLDKTISGKLNLAIGADPQGLAKTGPELAESKPTTKTNDETFETSLDFTIKNAF
ncbi:hypothetical protein [Mycoplasma bradburyae]|uniref:Lipoprotein n=1 Tax=Mycoplasma bradburyae TaxID=2963128 RepID=A0ABT5GAL0_9MOLU|nr:hypothetical protein [Mycoplasma bradburyae]MDC4182014.1 hypothetical protein [Mycoplasma bradburyae]UTS70439.1 hypothetical protein NMG68_01730 [Mycoplasma bradburyae]